MSQPTPSPSSVTLPTRYGWIGLGAMGYPMAMQLRKKLPTHNTLSIYDVNARALQSFVEETKEFGDVSIAASAKEVTEGADCVFVMVPEGEHVKAVFLTPDTGVLAADIAGKLFIDCSTIDRASSLAVGEAIAAASSSQPAHFYDAPVSGGTIGAEKATLTIMVGIAPSSPHFPLLHALLSLMGSKIYPMGGPSLGLAAKLSNNYISSLIALATAEGMNLGMRLGLDAKVFSECLKTCTGSSWINSDMNPVPGVCPNAVTSKGYEGGFKVQLMKKDLGLAIKAAEQVDAKIVLGHTGLEAYTAASDDPRCRDRDARVVYRWLGGVEPEVK
ncbi:hypothetical protein HGRIS_002836 [Hohenbuehelia grisea]|uniref:3-hydroxyisobutyrate dehydrogenase n=1 Tax=Hohenbuehelia grisea TaxID=104357 RepID=A0ABR3JLQ0_9AGAR